MANQHTPEVVSGYFSRLIDRDNVPRTVRRVCKLLRRHDFDSVAFTGVSGAVIAPIIAYKMNKSLLVVRKRDDKSNHSGLRVEGDRAARRYVIVDDFFSSGKTAGRIIHEIRMFQSQAVCVGGIAASDVARVEFSSRTEKPTIHWYRDEQGYEYESGRIDNLAA